MAELILVFSIIFIVFLIVVLSSRTKIFHVYEKYSKIKNTAEITGGQLAYFYKEKYNIPDLKFAKIEGELTDCYIPSKKTLAMSETVAMDDNIASLAIVSHEFGHAMQHKNKYFLYNLTHFLKKLTLFTNPLIIPLLIVGIIMTLFEFHFYNIEYITLYTSIVLFGFNFLLKMLTIPVEYNASHRGLKQLTENEIITKKELRIVKTLLNCAALTYIAGLFDGFIPRFRR